MVKKALMDHIDMDPPQTLQVLCDQCIFEPEELNEEEKVFKTRLRGLVLRFLVADTRRRYGPGQPAPRDGSEQALATGLINVSFRMV